MGAMAPVPQDHPLMKAWEHYKATEDGSNTRHWACQGEKFVDGALWAAFDAGFRAATERAASLHESINPASDQERHDGSPGAGAMGAVIEYRDAIRAPR
jgi:hypothetical protein